LPSEYTVRPLLLVLLARVQTLVLARAVHIDILLFHKIHQFIFPDRLVLDPLAR